MFRSFDPDNLGNRTAAAYGNGASEALGYDPVSRLTSLTVDLSGTASDLTKTFSYNPASQIISETRSNTAYSHVASNGAQTTVTNGLNQLLTVNGTPAAYDTRGNMTTDPATANTYSYLKTNNQLATVTTPFTSFTYDGLDRLASVNNGGAVTSYVTDGTNVVAEYDSSNVLQKRYAFDGTGWPLVQYDAAGNRTWMLPDERGSIVALANDSATMTAINSYDEYGIPAASNAGTFQYASMLWLSRAGLYAPTFRAYGAHLGTFNQTDPIGMAGGINLYAYVGNDPVNRADPLGLACYVIPDPDIGVCGHPTAPLTIAEITPGPDSRKEGTDQRRDGGADKSQKQKQKQPKCISPSAGPVYVEGAGFSLTIGVGASLSVAHFSIPSTGQSGWITSGGGHLGLEGFAGGFAGRYDTMGDLLGVGWQFTAEIPGTPGGGFGAFSSSFTGRTTGFLGSIGGGGGASLGRVGTRLTPHSGTLCK